MGNSVSNVVSSVTSSDAGKIGLGVATGGLYTLYDQFVNKPENQANNSADQAARDLEAARKAAMIEGPQANAGSLLDRRRLFAKGLAQSPLSGEIKNGY